MWRKGGGKNRGDSSRWANPKKMKERKRGIARGKLPLSPEKGSRSTVGRRGDQEKVEWQLGRVRRVTSGISQKKPLRTKTKGSIREGKKDSL